MFITVLEFTVGDHAKFYTTYFNYEILSIFQRDTFAELEEILPILHVHEIFMFRENDTNVDHPFKN